MIEGQKLSRKSGQGPGRFPILPPSFRKDDQPFQAATRRLRGPVPQQFEAFYRVNLRFVPGARVRSSDLSRFYAAWAAATGAPSLSMPEIKRAMANIGHRAVNSNGVQYCDVAVSAECEGLPDNYPTTPLPSEAHAAAIADRLEAMITELSTLRADLVGGHSHH